ELGYVEQLYTFGDKGRDAPLADIGAGEARVISVGYLALTPMAVDLPALDVAWAPWARFFPWEDWRQGRPSVIDAAIVPALTVWGVWTPAPAVGQPNCSAFGAKKRRPGRRQACRCPCCATSETRKRRALSGARRLVWLSRGRLLEAVDPGDRPGVGVTAVVE